MNLDKLVAISGRPGIYKMAANRKNGLIVEDFDTKKRFFVSGRIHQFTPLESISIYTTDGDGTVELKTVFMGMLKHGEPVKTNASSGEIREYFGEILPTFDRHKVLISDIKKLIKWYNFLIQRDLLDLEEEVVEIEETEDDKAAAGEMVEATTEENQDA
ncbi:MAG: DUF5606 domain-containing protein [Saprospiraceae bacterium]|nr:DUF5606 domain-containing protein [Saprospiraceae bacterium]